MVLRRIMTTNPKRCQPSRTSRKTYQRMQTSKQRIHRSTTTSQASISLDQEDLPRFSKCKESQMERRSLSNSFKIWRMSENTNSCTTKSVWWICARTTRLCLRCSTHMSTRAVSGSLWRSWTTHWHPWLLECTLHTLRTAADMWLGRHYSDFTTCIRSILSIETSRVITSW